MKLETICNRFAAKILGNYGTIVQCMDDVGSGNDIHALRRGLLYTVKGVDYNDKMIQLSGGCRYFATRFRKAD